jgi:hypothetical protein
MSVRGPTRGSCQGMYLGPALLCKQQISPASPATVPRAMLGK